MTHRLEEQAPQLKVESAETWFGSKTEHDHPRAVGREPVALRRARNRLLQWGACMGKTNPHILDFESKSR